MSGLDNPVGLTSQVACLAAIARLSKQLEALEDRLSPVLSSGGVEDDAAGAKLPPRSALLEGLSQLEDKLGRLQDRISL